MKKCWECGGKCIELTKKTRDQISYNHYRCIKCGDEVLDMKQLHELADKYRIMKKYHTKIAKWGLSLGVRIPKELAKMCNMKDKGDVVLIPEKDSIRIMPM